MPIVTDCSLLYIKVKTLILIGMDYGVLHIAFLPSQIKLKAI